MPPPVPPQPVAPVPPQPAAPAEKRKRLSPVARLAVLEWIRRVWHRLPPSKCIPNGGELGAEVDGLVQQWDCIANRQVICRVCLLYKRCLDRDALTVSACLDDTEDLRDVVLIKLGDMGLIAQDVMDKLPLSPICTQGLCHLQYREAVLAISTDRALKDKMILFARQYLTCLAHTFPASYATKESQVQGNEARFATVHLHMRERARQRFSQAPPPEDRDTFGRITYDLPFGYQRNTITPLADAVRRLVPSATWDGSNFAAESVMLRVEEGLFTAFCRALGSTADAAAPVKTYDMYPPSSRTAQTLYYIAGFIVFKILRPSLKRVDTRSHEIRRNVMHALFWGMECAQHRRGIGHREESAAAALAAGIPPELVEATRARRTTGPHGNVLPAVFVTMPVYRLVTLLETNFRKCITVGTLCANPAAIATLEETLRSDSLVVQEFRRTLEAVTAAGRLAAAQRADDVVERDLLRDTELSDADLCAAVADFEARGIEGARQVRYSLEERDRGADDILRAILRVFFNVRGRDLVRALMSRRDVYQHEASSVSLRGSIAVVSQRLRDKLKALGAKAAESAPGTLHHCDSAATNVGDDGEVPSDTYDAIDAIIASIDVDELTQNLCGLSAADQEAD